MNVLNVNLGSTPGHQDPSKNPVPAYSVSEATSAYTSITKDDSSEEINMPGDESPADCHDLSVFDVRVVDSISAFAVESSVLKVTSVCNTAIDAIFENSPRISNEDTAKEQLLNVSSLLTSDQFNMPDAHHQGLNAQNAIDSKSMLPTSEYCSPCSTQSCSINISVCRDGETTVDPSSSSPQSDNANLMSSPPSSSPQPQSSSTDIFVCQDDENTVDPSSSSPQSVNDNMMSLPPSSNPQSRSIDISVCQDDETNVHLSSSYPRSLDDNLMSSPPSSSPRSCTIDISVCQDDETTVDPSSSYPQSVNDNLMSSPPSSSPQLFSSSPLASSQSSQICEEFVSPDPDDNNEISSYPQVLITRSAHELESESLTTTYLTEPTIAPECEEAHAGSSAEIVTSPTVPGSLNISSQVDSNCKGEELVVKSDEKEIDKESIMRCSIDESDISYAKIIAPLANIQKAISIHPSPKRPTLAYQRLQHRKLTKPFRPPTMMVKADEGNGTSAVISAKDYSQPTTDSKELTDTKKKHRTTRAAAQFKSPLAAGVKPFAESAVRMTPTIQALEQKLQTIRRAVKVKQENQEEQLEGLIRKWTEAGRDVAWEVWELVKNRGEAADGTQPQKRKFADSWGWDDKGDSKKECKDERNWGWDVVPHATEGMEVDVEETEDGKESVRDTLGTMLMQLGIGWETLGWDENECTFVDK